MMAFVNEYIQEADYEKYDLRKICGEHNLAHRGHMYRRDWTIDREREAFLIQVWTHREAVFNGWAFYWQGEWMFFELHVADAWVNKITDERWSHYQVKGFVVPPTLKAQQEKLVADFRSACSAYAGGGVFCKTTHRSATVEFIEE
jgi:hypothetical protein